MAPSSRSWKQRMPLPGTLFVCLTLVCACLPREIGTIDLHRGGFVGVAFVWSCPVVGGWWPRVVVEAMRGGSLVLAICILAVGIDRPFSVEGKWQGEAVRGWKKILGFSSIPETDGAPPPDDFKTKDVKGKVVLVGTVVRAKWRQGEKFYTGYVDLVNPDGSVDIQYDDGDYEWFVQPENIERLDGRKRLKVKADELLTRPDVLDFMKRIDYSIYGAKNKLPAEGEKKFLQDDQAYATGQTLSDAERGALLNEDELFEIDLNDEKASWLRAAASAKNNKTQCGRGHFGLGLIHSMQGDSDETALSHYHKAADCGDPSAQRVLGLTYGISYEAMTADQATDKDSSALTEGHLGDEDLSAEVKHGYTAKSILYLYFAAMGGDAPAQLALGTRHLYGRGVPKKCESAVLYLQAAAEAAESSVEDLGQENIVDSVLLSEQVSDGLSGRRARQRHGSGGNGDGLDDNIIQYLSYAARNGDHSAQTSLGEIYYFGIRGVRRDAEKALSYFQEGAEGGSERAMAMLGHMYTRGHGVPASNKTALSWFQKSADKDGKTAHSHLGMFYLFGLGVKRNVTKARLHFQHAANEGESGAMHSLGIMRIKGLGIRRDYAKALRLFRQAARQSHTLAENKVAHMTLLGIGTPPDCEAAAKSFKKVAEHGPWAMKLQVAYREFLNGRLGSSLWLYRMLSGEGYPTAESNVAFLLEKEALSTQTPLSRLKRAMISSSIFRDLAKMLFPGEASDMDSVSTATTRRAAEESVAFYTLAAQQGSAQAYVQMGDLYYFGLVGRRGAEAPNFAKAVSYYTKASKANNGQGRFNLGYMYEHGLGVSQDVHLAKRYYDETRGLDREAAIPVLLTLYRMRFLLAWERIYGKFFGKGSPASPTASSKVEPDAKKVNDRLRTTKDQAGLALKRGTMVAGNWLGRNHYYSGYIAKINADGTADVQYDDGDFEHNVPSSRLRRKSPERIHPLYSDHSQPAGDAVAFVGAFGLPNIFNADDESILMSALVFCLGCGLYYGFCFLRWLF